MENKFGAMPPKIDKRDYKLAGARAKIEYPEEFYLEMGEVKDQGSVNSCVAHGAAEIIEYFNKMQEQIEDKMSVGYIYGRRYGYKGEGMYLRDALKTIQKEGTCDNKQFPYNKEVPEIIELLNSKIDSITGQEKNRISTYFSLNGVDDIKEALMNYGPVMISIKWYRDIKLENGVIKSSLKGDYGNHCLIITGWNKNGWKAMNSWSDRWGDNGYAILPFDFPLNEAWGITDSILRDGEIVVPKRNWFLDLIYKIVNFFLNLFKKD